jgi:putative component of membrane protein insertase Oxa1/YidC/SpoIIIJ protein YidD
MKWIMLAAISFYRTFIRPYRPCECLFEIHCSEYVKRVAMHKGWIESLKALFNRYCLCRSGLLVASNYDKELILVGAHGETALLSTFTAEVQLEIRYSLKNVNFKNSDN